MPDASVFCLAAPLLPGRVRLNYGGIGLLRPYRAWMIRFDWDPGRCPGLCYGALSGLSTPIH